MSIRSRERMYGSSVRAAVARAAAARKEADKLACEAWNKQMPGFRGPARPSPTFGDALNAGYGFLEVRCLGTWGAFLQNGYITGLGWRRIDELRRAHISSQSAFFARKFANAELDRAFAECLQPAVNQLSLIHI